MPKTLTRLVATVGRRSAKISTIIMSLTAVLTAWSGYQSSLWESRRTLALAEAATMKREATRLDNRADKQYLIDIGLFQGYLRARLNGDERLARFYEQHLPAHMEQPFQDWQALRPEQNPQSPASPFSLPGYVIPAALAAQKTMESGFALEATARDASHTSSRYTRTTVFFALVLFFAGLAPRSDYPWMRTVLLTVAVFALAIAVLQIVILPVTSLDISSMIELVETTR